RPPAARGERELPRDQLEPLERVAALLAAGHVAPEEPLDQAQLVLVERVQGVARQELLDDLVLVAHSSRSVSARCSFRMAARVRVFTVPRGTPSCSAIWACVNPPKYASSKTRRCSGGSPSSAVTTMARRRASQASSTMSSATSSSCAGPGFIRTVLRRRRSSRRTVSTARWCTRERKKVRKLPRAGSN